MNGGYDCGKEYNTVVIPFWKRFGYKPKNYGIKSIVIGKKD